MMACPVQCGRRSKVEHEVCPTCWRVLSPARRSELRRTRSDAYANLSDDRRWRDYRRARWLALHELRRSR